MHDFPAPQTTLAAALFEALPVAALVHGEQTLLASNAAARRILRASAPEELENRPIADIVHPDGHTAGEQRRELLLKHGQQFVGLPVKLLTLMGEPVPMTVTGVTFTHGRTPIAIVAACEQASCVGGPAGVILPPTAYPDDIPLLEAALDAFPLPVVAVYGNEIAYANRATSAVLHARNAQGLIGRPLTDFVHPDTAESVAEQLFLTLERGVDLGRTRTKSIALNGAVIDSQGSGGHLRHDGRDYGLFVVTQSHE